MPSCATAAGPALTSCAPNRPPGPSTQRKSATGSSEVLVSRARSGILHAASLTRDSAWCDKPGPRFCSAPLREELRAALRPGNAISCSWKSSLGQRLLQVQVAGIELAERRQPFPILRDQHAFLEIHGAGGTKILQGAVHGGNRHAEALSELHQADRRGEARAIAQAGGAGAIEQLAKQMAHPRRHVAGAVVGDRFAKDRGVDQGFAPDR